MIELFIIAWLILGWFNIKYDTATHNIMCIKYGYVNQTPTNDLDRIAFVLLSPFAIAFLLWERYVLHTLLEE